MARERSAVEPLGRQHDRAAFACGGEALDRSLRAQASQDQRRHVAAVFVLVDRIDGALAGSSTPSAASLALTLTTCRAMALMAVSSLTASTRAPLATGDRRQRRGWR